MNKFNGKIIGNPLVTPIRMPDWLQNIENGDGEKSLVINEGQANGDYSIAGGTTDKSIIESIAGSAATSLIDVNEAKANGVMSIAFGADTEAKTAGTVTFGVANIVGVKGYYWHTIDYDKKTITLSTTRPTTLSNSVKAPDNLDWAVGDYISIIGHDKHPFCTKITAISGNTITVEEIPPSFANSYDTLTAFGTTVYPATYTTPHDRTIYAVYEDKYISVLNQTIKRWMSRSGTVDLGLGGFSTGALNRVTGLFASAKGRGNLAIGDYSDVAGQENIAGAWATAKGWLTRALGKFSLALGHNTTASGDNSIATGEGTTASGTSSRAGGHLATASGDYSSSDGYSTTASGMSARATGAGTTASGDRSLAQCSGTLASGYAAHADGDGTEATNTATYSGGYKTKASGFAARSHGGFTEARAPYSQTGVYHTIAGSKMQRVSGQFNIIDEDAKYLDIVGNGTSEENRSNAYTLDWDGNAEFAGDVTANGISLKELSNRIGDIETALDNIIAIQNTLIGGDSE